MHVVPGPLAVAPVLAVEVLTSNTELLDRHTRKATYERAGTPSFWIVDPGEPRLIVFELDEHGRYQVFADVHGDDTVEVERPFAVRISPADSRRARSR